jgi:alpha-beta hydrolase superfamily lysophospholipase
VQLEKLFLTLYFLLLSSLIAFASHAEDFYSSGKYANLPGVKLWYVDSGGTGEPIVLLHANTGNSSIWHLQWEALKQAGYRVIVFDRRNWGKVLPIQVLVSNLQVSLRIWKSYANTLIFKNFICLELQEAVLLH